MKVIFLDIDGVLNDADTHTYETINGFTGIDDDKVARLKHIVDTTGAEIVLTSTWKFELNDDLQPVSDWGKYLLDKFAKQGLTIFDKTQLRVSGEFRGQEILTWLETYPVDQWVVVDDYFFRDFDRVRDHLVITDELDGGLNDNIAEQIINMLTEI